MMKNFKRFTQLTYNNKFCINMNVIVKVCYPKSDEQRGRLSEAFSNCFLFKNLEPVSRLILSVFNFCYSLYY